MKTIKIERAHVYNFGFGECLMILDTIYGIDDKVKVAYVVGDTIKGYITTKKVYSSYPVVHTSFSEVVATTLMTLWNAYFIIQSISRRHVINEKASY